MAQIMAGRYEDAEDTLSASLIFTPPDNPLLACHFAFLYEAQNRLGDCYACIFKWLERVGKIDRTDPPPEEVLLRLDWYSFTMGMATLAIGRSGFVDYATERMDGLLASKAKWNRTSSVEIAIGLIGLCRYDEAVEWLNRAAFEEYDPYTMWFHIFPPLRHLRGHEGYRKLLKTLNLPLPPAP